MTDIETAPTIWRGPFFEDFAVGDAVRSRLGRTMTEVSAEWTVGVSD